MNIYKKVKPPEIWKVPVIVLVGVIFGLGIFILKISKATSYVSDDPKVCLNCHVMVPQYASWRSSSHAEWATCNDCHVPQDNALNKYLFKAKDGIYHASIYTMRAEPQVIRIKEMGANAVQQNCVRCHEDQVTDARLSSTVNNHVVHRTDRQCWECHREVPHGKQRSLSTFSIVNDIQDENNPVVPDWLEKELKHTNENKSTDNVNQ